MCVCASRKYVSNVTNIFHFQANVQPLATWLGVLRKCLAFSLCNCLRAYSYVYCILHSFQCVHRDSQRNQSYEQKLCVDSQVYPPITGIVHLRCRQNSIAAKWNIFLSFGLKVPFGFPCFAHVCLESWLGLVFFSTAYVTLVVALLFGGLVLLLAFLQGFFNRFLSLRCSTVTLLEVGALACFYEWMDCVSDFATYA